MSNLGNFLNKMGVECENRIQEWKPIVGFKNVADNVYEVSNDGEIRDIVTKELRHKKIATKLYHSYYAVSLKHKNGQLGWILVHQLVAWFFVPVPDELIETLHNSPRNLVVDHLDNNGLNNYYANLEWTTRNDNIKRSRERNDMHSHGNRVEDINFANLHTIYTGLVANKSYKEIITECGFEYNEPNVKFLRQIARNCIHIDWNKIISGYGEINNENITANSSRPSAVQSDIVQNLETIRNLIRSGKTNGEIVDMLWPDLPKTTRKSRVRTVHHIREGKIYNTNNIGKTFGEDVL